MLKEECQNTILIKYCGAVELSWPTSYYTDLRKHLVWYKSLQKSHYHFKVFLIENEINDVKTIISSNITYHITISVSIQILAIGHFF